MLAAKWGVRRGAVAKADAAGRWSARCAGRWSPDLALSSCAGRWSPDLAPGAVTNCCAKIHLSVEPPVPPGEFYIAPRVFFGGDVRFDPFEWLRPLTRGGAAETLRVFRPLYPGLEAERPLARRAVYSWCANLSCNTALRKATTLRWAMVSRPRPRCGVWLFFSCWWVRTAERVLFDLNFPGRMRPTLRLLWGRRSVRPL